MGGGGGLWPGCFGGVVQPGGGIRSGGEVNPNDHDDMHMTPQGRTGLQPNKGACQHQSHMHEQEAIVQTFVTRESSFFG